MGEIPLGERGEEERGLASEREAEEEWNAKPGFLAPLSKESSLISTVQFVFSKVFPPLPRPTEKLRQGWSLNLFPYFWTRLGISNPSNTFTSRNVEGKGLARGKRHAKPGFLPSWSLARHYNIQSVVHYTVQDQGFPPGPQMIEVRRVFEYIYVHSKTLEYKQDIHLRGGEHSNRKETFFLPH